MWIELVKSACRLFLLLQQRRGMLLRGAKVSLAPSLSSQYAALMTDATMVVNAAVQGRGLDSA